MADSLIALTIFPVIAQSAVRKRFPKLCPSNPSPVLNLYWNNSVIKSSSSPNAAIQFLISPGGSIPISFLSLPELPPSSPTVTIAVILLVYFFIPLRSMDKPVPPPIATTFAPLLSFLLLYNFSKIEELPLVEFISIIDKVVFCHPLKKIIEPKRINTAARRFDGRTTAAL